LQDQLHAYIERLIPERPEFFITMEKYAGQHQIPIMELAGMETMLQLLRIQNPKKILEVGTAIGYSALRMAEALPNTQVVTIERDLERASIAEQNIQALGMEDRVILIKGDALEVESQVAAYGHFDAIFIDAAKGQYKRFFEMYSSYLTQDGMIITDNVLFKGLVAAEQIEHKRTAQLVKKINQFNEWLMSHPNFYTAILPVGDGVAISKKR
jgi:predicted O-methyltransferase YrrM